MENGMIDKARVSEILESFRQRRILVLGDLMLDRYLSGTVDRISPEAPVPVVRVTGEYSQPGGAANVALNIQSLGGQASVAGFVGDDEAGAELIGLMAKNGIATDGICVVASRATTVKTRILAERQQVVRVDQEEDGDPAGSDEADLADRVSALTKDVDGVIIEDYGKGAVAQQVVDAVLAAAKASRVLVGFDPKNNHELELSGLTLATPNYVEACSAAGVSDPGAPIVDGEQGPMPSDSLAGIGETLLNKWTAELLIITLGASGMFVLRSGEAPRVIPTEAREVFDVSGAGDTVIGAAMLGIASGNDLYESASLANYAAGVVVAKIGTAPCTAAELIRAVALTAERG